MAFKLKLSSGKDFENAPEGTQQAVVVDVIDLGMRPDFYKPGESVQKVQIAFQTEEEMSTGQPFVVRSKPMKASMDNRANLRKMVETIWGPIKDEDLDTEGEFDIEQIIGKNCLITIEHSEPNEKGQIFANVVQVAQLPRKTTTVLEARDYIRVQDRPDSTDFNPEQYEAEAATAEAAV